MLIKGTTCVNLQPHRCYLQLFSLLFQFLEATSSHYIENKPFVGTIIVQVYRLWVLYCQGTRYSHREPGFWTRYSVSAKEISFAKLICQSDYVLQLMLGQQENSSFSTSSISLVQNIFHHCSACKSNLDALSTSKAGRKQSWGPSQYKDAVLPV